MSQNEPTDPTQAAPNQEPTPLAAANQLGQFQTKEEWDKFFSLLRDASRRQAEKIAPWLNEFGSWIFGGLIAFSILIIQGLILLGGPAADGAVLVSSVAFAAALPLDVAGLMMLRLNTDMKQYSFEEEMISSFQEAGFPMQGEDVSTAALGERQQQRSTTVLYISLIILVVSGLLTSVGMTAGLWHIAWWIGVVFIVMTLISANIVIFSMIRRDSRQAAATKEARERLDKMPQEQRVNWENYYREWITQQKKKS